MTSSPQSFQEFEHGGWRKNSVCRNYDAHFGAVTIQSVEPLLDAANVREHGRVLDVCSGAGYAAGAAADRGATVVGLDFSESQVEIAQARYLNATFQAGDATDLPFEANVFDSVVNSIGIPHFEDPDAAIREAFRVLKGGGRFAFTVYDSPQNAVGFGALYRAVQRHGSMDLGLPTGPNFFQFSDPREGITRLEAAGFESVEVSIVEQTWRLASPEELFSAVEIGSVRASATLRGQTPEARQAIKAAVTDTMSRYRNADGYELPMPVVLYCASKPME